MCSEQISCAQSSPDIVFCVLTNYELVQQIYTTHFLLSLLYFIITHTIRIIKWEQYVELTSNTDMRKPSNPNSSGRQIHVLHLTNPFNLGIVE